MIWLWVAIGAVLMLGVASLLVVLWAQDMIMTMAEARRNDVR